MSSLFSQPGTSRWMTQARAPGWSYKNRTLTELHHLPLARYSPRSFRPLPTYSRSYLIRCLLRTLGTLKRSLFASDVPLTTIKATTSHGSRLGNVRPLIIVYYDIAFNYLVLALILTAVRSSVSMGNLANFSSTTSCKTEDSLRRQTCRN